MTMNNPYFNVLNENLRDTIEANGDILITRDPAQSQSRQNAQIIDMLNEGIDILFVNAVDRSGIESALYECKKSRTIITFKWQSVFELENNIHYSSGHRSNIIGFVSSTRYHTYAVRRFCFLPDKEFGKSI